MLTVAVGVCGYVGYWLSANFVLGPRAKLEAEAKDLRSRIRRLDAENRREGAYRARLRELAGRTFGGDEPAVREQMRARLIQLLEQGGLSTEGLVSQPLQGKRLKHKGKASDRSVGRSIAIRGKPSHIVNFLYLLKKDPHVHRVQSLSLAPDPRTGEMDLRLKYFTLVLDGVGAAAPATNPPVTLDGPERDRYDVIVHRDVFRPYTPRKKVAHRPTERPEATPYPFAPQPPGSASSAPAANGRLRVTGLSTLSGVPEVSVLDRSSGEVKTYKLGEMVGNGTIVMIDYRPMPTLEDPEDLSTSRVILRMGGGYWAVEIGQYLAQKHRLKASELPPELRGSSRTRPAAPAAAETSGET